MTNFILRLKRAIEHYTNPLHIMCRMFDIGCPWMRKTILFHWYNRLWGKIFVRRKKFIEYRKMGRRMYQLHRSYHQDVKIFPGTAVIAEFISLSQTGLLIIKSGFVWDGSSGPTVQTKSTMRGSLVHDALYELMRKELLAQTWRYRADVVIRDNCLEDGMWKWRAKLWFRALRTCAEPFADPKRKRPVLRAP